MDGSTSKTKVNLFCCNPLNKPKHNYHNKNLRLVNNNLLHKFSSKIKSGDKICDSCRKLLSNSVNKDQSTEPPSDDTDDDSPQEINISSPEKADALACLNRSLIAINESPIKKHRLLEKIYPAEKLKRVSEAFKFKVLETSDTSDSLETPSPGDEILLQMKEKFRTTTDKSVIMQILTTLPYSWTVQKIQDEFGVANYTARKAKILQKEKGIMSYPDSKPGKTLKPEIAAKVQSFYESEEVSRIMPGRKDFVSVKVCGKREHIQKQLILCNLKELFVHFREKHSDIKIGFSKFCELRPKYCVLAGASGTHSVCVCTIHQNAKLKVAQCKFPELREGEKLIKTYQDALQTLICDNPSESCYFGECSNCPGADVLRARLEYCFEVNCLENVTFKQWVIIDKNTSLETFTKPREEFINDFIESLPKLLRHSFIAKQQSSFLSHLKEVLKEGEFIVLCDFAENYSFILQDAAQGYHWNNAQATIHPFSIYSRSDLSGELQHTSFVVISDCPIHDTIAVHCFQRVLMDFMRSHFTPTPSKIYYFSDGCGAQYKNRLNFFNLCLHEEDFGVKAEWHFFATSHGKSSCDGIGGTVKSLAARESLRLVYNEQIMTPRQLYEWAKVNISSMHFAYSTIQKHKNEEMILKNRKISAQTIEGALKLHCFIPLSKSKVLTKLYSFSASSREAETTTRCDDELDFTEIVGFVTCLYGDFWWLACVLDSFEDKQEFKVSFLHPHGPAPSNFTYPTVPDILRVHRSSILTTVDPLTATGRVYTLTKAETENATRKLFAVKQM